MDTDEIRRLAEQKRADAERARQLVRAVSSLRDRDRFRQVAAELESEADDLEHQAENLN
jgi:hypothetical protein